MHKNKIKELQIKKTIDKILDVLLKQQKVLKKLNKKHHADLSDSSKVPDK